MSDGGGRHIVLHGHFYQPPRENPWIEEIEVQDSAAPYHDWNERITAECYGPNSAARIVVEGGGVVDIINNFAKISFNVGPTLLSWLEPHAPAVYRKILEADRSSAAERGGHGNAIAQAYNHAILPLCNARDRITQIRWGIEDFRRRFGRAPEGMWLPECAVDEDTLVRLSDEGLKFTILAQRQARRHRRLAVGPGGGWQEGVDPRRAYRVELPAGRSIAVFFFDDGVAKDISFGGALADRDAFVNRLVDAFGQTPAGQGPWLVNVATDGETFGHHRAFGDMVVAAAIERIERERPARLTNYAEYLALHPPERVAEIVTPSSWSCFHGVARWQGDCGCTTNARPGWHQRWRRPLREAFDELRDRLSDLYERRGAELLRDPWAARDAYVSVVLDRSPGSVDAFFDEHAHHELDHGEQTTALKLLELQRHALLMYTSCAWFFGEVSGVETIQSIKYAARALELAREIDATEAGGASEATGSTVSLEPMFHAALARAPSNLPEQGDAARVLAERVRRSVVPLGGVAAHYALSSMFDDHPQAGRIFCFRFEARDAARRTRGPVTLAVGRVRLVSDITREELEASYVLLHFGAQDLRCAVKPLTCLPAYADLEAELLTLFEHRSVGDVVRAIDRHFAGRDYGLGDLFLDERRKIVRVLVGDILARHDAQLTAIFDENRPLLRFLIEGDVPVPPPLRAAADHTLSERYVELAAQARHGGPRFASAAAQLVKLKGEADALAAQLEIGDARRIFEVRILEEARSLRVTPRAETARALLAYLELAAELGLRPDVWEAQNLYWTLTLEGPQGPDLDVALLLRLGARLGFERGTLEHHFRERGAGRPDGGRTVASVEPDQDSA